MMPHRRTRALIAAFVVAALSVTAVWPADGLPGWVQHVLQLAVPIAALAVLASAAGAAVVWAVPHGVRSVRAGRARWTQCRARRKTVPDAPAPTTSGTAARTRQESGAAKLFVVGIAGSALAVAVATVALNSAHNMDVARFNGETGWRAWLYPLPADGLLISASLMLVWQLLESGRATWLPRIAFAVGIAYSAGANVLAALHADVHGTDLAERIGWITGPTLVLTLSHEMLLLMLARWAVKADLFGNIGPDPAIVAAEDAQRQAEERAASAERLAAEQLAAASARSDAALDELRTATTDQIAHLREQLDAEQQSHTEQRRRLHQAQADERAAAKDVLDRITAERDAAVAAQTRIEAELEELADDTAADDTRDFSRVAAIAAAWVEGERRNRPHESLVPEVADLFGVSLRWVQQRVPAAIKQKQQSSETSPELAFAV